MRYDLPMPDSRTRPRWRPPLIAMILALLACVPHAGAAPPAGRPAVTLTPSAELRARLTLARGHLLTPDGPFLRDLGWGADQHARWLETMEWLNAALGETTGAVDARRAAFLRLQQPDGTILMPGRNDREWWGATRALLYLARRVAAHPDDRASLLAAERLGRLFGGAGVLPSHTDTLIQAGPLAGIEGLVLLGRVTGQREFTDTATRMAVLVDSAVAPPGLAPRVHGGDSLALIYSPRRHEAYRAHEHHTHSYLEAMVGLVELSAATGQAGSLERARRVRDRIVEHTLWASGGVPELFGEPFEYNDETCAVVSWLRLNLKLGQVTGDRRAWDLAEWVLLNHLPFNQEYRGGFCTDRSLSRTFMVRGTNRGRTADECCSMHGPRALLEALAASVAAGDAGLDFRLYLAGGIDADLGRGARFRAELGGAYADSGTVRLRIDRAPNRPVRLRFRTPAWHDAAPEIRVNGVPFAAPVTEGYCVVERRFRPGDRIELYWSWSLGLLKDGENGFNHPRTERLPSDAPPIFTNAVLVRGPLVLALDRSINMGLTLGDVALALFVEPDGTLSLPAARWSGHPPGPMMFAAARRTTGSQVLEATTADFGDGEAASFGGGPEAAWRRITLVPMAEAALRPMRTMEPYRVRHTLLVLPATDALRILPIGE